MPFTASILFTQRNLGKFRIKMGKETDIYDLIFKNNFQTSTYNFLYIFEIFFKRRGKNTISERKTKMQVEN